MIIDHPAPGSEPHLRRLWQNAFGDPDAFLDDFFRTAYSPARCLCAWEDHRLLAAVYWFGCTCREQRIAYLYALAVEEDCRGRGIGTVLMEKTHAVLASQGYAGVLLVPQQTRLQALYTRLGYSRGPEIGQWHCRAADEGTALRSLDAPAYAAARRAYLPVGGVGQAGENLSFLQTQARFWAGEDFVLTARLEENRLTGLELLGNLQAAPRILRALHCTEGTFRTLAPRQSDSASAPVGNAVPGVPPSTSAPVGNAVPGVPPFTSVPVGNAVPGVPLSTSAPLAMFRPLGEAPAFMPAYFAFPFD